MRNIIIDLQNSDAWKIQLTIAINFTSLKDGEEECAMHASSGNIKFTAYSDANDVVDELSESLRSRYQENLETSMKRSGFIFNSVQLMYCKCHKVSFIHGDTYIDSPDWIKKKKKSFNKSEEYRQMLFLIHSNCCVKLWRNWITSRKSFKY